ncbi:MAG TPA: lipid-A-disaccharide synthase, partial [Candidatus Hydrogenedentes bacterium]|nr:lipid-A-disaccharide synthase [Candidatus Hydrogenedentota bacterium]
LFGVPLAVLYKVSYLSYWIARSLVRVKHISLVNILSGKGIVPEFIQHEASPERVLPAALELIEDGPARRQMLDDLAGMRLALGGGGASRCAATEILNVIGEARHDRTPVPD